MESSFKVDNLRGSAVIFINFYALEVLCTKLLAKAITWKPSGTSMSKKWDLRMTQRIKHNLCTYYVSLYFSGFFIHMKVLD